MAIHPNPDRNKDYMYKMWGTTDLITDYWTGNVEKEELREVVGDNDHKKEQNFNDDKTLLE